MQKVKKEYGLKISTEVASEKHVFECLKYGVDLVWIGARTTANPFLVQEIADALRDTDIPVLVKNPVNPDIDLWIGALERLNKEIHFTGCGTHPRQEKPHPHFTGFTPDGKYLIVVDLGLDAVKLFAFDPEKGLTDVEKPYFFKVEIAGSGPRHLAFNRAGNIAYLVNEIGNTVCVLDYKAGKFSCRQIISTLPADFSGETKAAAIRLSPDERWLFATNRGYDSIAVYRVLPDGELALQDIVPSEGESPRDINFLPDGLQLAAANEFTNNTAFFKFDPESGKLAYYASESMPNPLAVYW
jgi:6-phosphogluconolactonase